MNMAKETNRAHDHQAAELVLDKKRLILLLLMTICCIVTSDDVQAPTPCNVMMGSTYIQRGPTVSRKLVISSQIF